MTTPGSESATDPKPMFDCSRFMVSTRGRTGSGFLLSLLDHHPRLRQRGEIFGESRLRDASIRDAIVREGPVRHLARQLGRRGLERAIGFKLLYYQTDAEYARRFGVDGLAAVRDYCKQRDDLKVIHLKRRNKLRTLVSMRTAAITKQYVVRDLAERKPPPRLTLDAAECEREFERIADWEAAHDRDFAHHELIEVFYEDLVARTDEECDRLLDFLGLRRRACRSRLVQQNFLPLPEAIANYAELQDHFAGTRWSALFDAQPISET